ncbi:MAG TPA: hypothetical protein VFQ27_03220 [Xanthobacteraceae bacterium]|nr:hypothetical protein [Xanthobacteraceae bacterium]
MYNGLKTAALALSCAGLLALSAPSSGIAMPSAGMQIHAAADTLPGRMTDVRWRGRHHGGGALVAGLAAGIIGAAAVGAFARPYYYYDYPYYPYYPSYAYYGPRYYYGGPYGYHRRVHWRHRHWHHRRYYR